VVKFGGWGGDKGGKKKHLIAKKKGVFGIFSGVSKHVM